MFPKLVTWKILSKKQTPLNFVAKVAGATDIFRRQQILSQQAQKVDQLISDVYGNIIHQKEKLEQMNKKLDSDRQPDNWTSLGWDKEHYQRDYWNQIL